MGGRRSGTPPVAGLPGGADRRQRRGGAGRGAADRGGQARRRHGDVPGDGPDRGPAASLAGHAERVAVRAGARGCGVGLNSSVASSFLGWGRIPRNALVDISSLGSASPGPDPRPLLLFGLAVGPVNWYAIAPDRAAHLVDRDDPADDPAWRRSRRSRSRPASASDVIINKVGLVQAASRGGVRPHLREPALRQPAQFDIQATESSLISGLFFPFPRDPSAESQNWSLRVVGGPTPGVSELQLPGREPGHLRRR